MENIEPNPLAEAQKVIEQDKKERAEKFQAELLDLEKKYKCEIRIGYRLDNPNLPSVAQFYIQPL